MKDWFKKYILFVKERFWVQGILSLVLLGLLYVPALFGHGFADPDAFYHAKISLLMLQQGPIQFFPWLDLSLVGQHFADLHFLFHVLMVPFVALFGGLMGLRFGMLFLVGSFSLMFAACLRWLEIRFPWLWTVLCVSMAPLVIRLSLGKASAFALFWFVLGIAATLKRKKWVVLFAVFGFSLSHGGWMMLVGSVGILCASRVLFEMQLEERAASFWRRCVREIPFVCLALLGAIFGLLIHPNFPENIRFTWVQLVTIGLQTPTDRVLMGKEWMAPPLEGVISGLAPLFILGLLLLLGFLFARKERIEIPQAVRTLQLGSLFAVFFGFSLLSIRSAEYALPVGVLFFACASQFVDWRRLVQEQKKLFVLTCCLCAFAQILLYGEAIYNLRIYFFADDLYQGVTLAMRKAGGKDGDRVFHLLFDRFPMLFLQDDGFRYVTGLDPTFLLVTKPELSDRIDLALRHSEKLQVEDIEWMITQTQARFVFVPKVGSYLRFVELLNQKKELYTAIFEDSTAMVFLVK